LEKIAEWIILQTLPFAAKHLNDALALGLAGYPTKDLQAFALCLREQAFIYPCPAASLNEPRTGAVAVSGCQSGTPPLVQRLDRT
jgi:hypothetical protein